MAGIEKMTEVILADAKKEADSIISVAKEEAEKEKSVALDAVSNEITKKQSSLEKELEDFRLRAESARDLNKRRMILAKKQEIIARIVEKTRLALHEADSDSYFASLIKVFENHCQTEDGVMYLNSKDLDRLPKDFAERIENIAKIKGGKIEISKEAAEIEDGFLLIYSGTEENCTFRSLIESEKEDLYDEINRMLWRDANG